MSATTDRVARALSGIYHVDRIGDHPPMFQVHSGSGAQYEVVLGDTPRCNCDDWTHREAFCKHLWYVLLTHPEALRLVIRPLQTATSVRADGGNDSENDDWTMECLHCEQPFDPTAVPWWFIDPYTAGYVCPHCQRRVEGRPPAPADPGDTARSAAADNGGVDR